MLKYGRRGRPKQRHVFLKDKMICWQDPSEVIDLLEKPKKNKSKDKNKKSSENKKKNLVRAIPVLGITEI